MLWTYHPASELVAPWFATAASAHCSQNSAHLYLSVHNRPKNINIVLLLAFKPASEIVIGSSKALKI
jgi:hypothetical protein